MKKNIKSMMMTNMQDERKQHGNGFVIGLVIGIVLTFLFATKKGRKILHALTQEGSEKVAKWKEVLASDNLLEDELENGNDYIETSSKNPTNGRRFFRREKNS